MFIIYFFYAFGIAHLVVAITTLFHSGHDPFFIALSFIVMFGGACFLGAGYMFYKVKLMRDPVVVFSDFQKSSHYEEWLNDAVPAYIRREPEQLEFNFDHDDRS